MAMPTFMATTVVQIASLVALSAVGSGCMAIATANSWSKRFPAADACIDIVEPETIPALRPNDNVVLSPDGLEQDGIGRWWLNGKELEQAILTIKLRMSKGQWIPPNEPLTVQLPRIYSSTPVNVEHNVQLRPIAWSWRKNSTWPLLNETVLDEASKKSWQLKLQGAWSATNDDNGVPSKRIFPALLFRQLLNPQDRAPIESDIRSLLHKLQDSKIEVRFDEFRRVGADVDAARAFEVQEDTIRTVREKAGKFFRVAAGVQSEPARNTLHSVQAGALNSLFASNVEQTQANEYRAQLAQTQSVVNQLSQKLSSMNENIEEPIYHEFQHEDRYVVKKAVATAYLKVFNAGAPDTVIFSRKIVSDVTKADRFSTADAALGKKGDPLELPSDLQMKRDVTVSISAELAGQLKEGFLDRIGLEHYARAKAAQEMGDAETFAENGISFLFSPAAAMYTEQADDVLLLLDGLVRRATRSSRKVGIPDLFGLTVRAR